jgi:hypothetical protein
VAVLILEVEQQDRRVDVPCLSPLLPPFKTTAQLLAAAVVVAGVLTPSPKLLAICKRTALLHFPAAVAVVAVDQVSLAARMVAQAAFHRHSFQVVPLSSTHRRVTLVAA